VLTGPGEGYTLWVTKYDTLNEADRSAIRSECQRLKRRPLISLVITPGGASLDLLAGSLISVREQLYSTWEVGLPVTAEFSSQLPGSPLEPILNDSRVRKIEVPGSYDHLAATNAALTEAAGDFPAFSSPVTVSVKMLFTTSQRRFQQTATQTFSTLTKIQSIHRVSGRSPGSSRAGTATCCWPATMWASLSFSAPRSSSKLVC